MTEARKDGGPAFPISREQEGWFEPGMSLRDWFAGQAINEMIRAERQTSAGTEYNPARIAGWAYEVADAMLAQHVPPTAREEKP